MKLSQKIGWLILFTSFLAVFFLCACDNSDDDDDDDQPSAGDEEPLGDQLGLLGYDVGGARFITEHLGAELGVELSAGWFYQSHEWDLMTYFTVDNKQYIMGHGVKNEAGRYEWFIMEVLPSGDLGMVTDSGSWAYQYNTLIPLTFSDKTYIFAQDSDSENAYWWFVQEILPGGKLADSESDHGSADHFYPVVTPIPLAKTDRACFFGHTIDPDKHLWIVDCLHHDGTLWRKDSGHFEHGWQVALSYRGDDGTYLFGHREAWNYSDARDEGKWFTLYVDNAGGITSGESFADSGTWNNFYLTMNVFKNPDNDWHYLLGQNTDKHFFIQHIHDNGKMAEPTYSHDYSDYYNYMFPIWIDSNYYHTDDWMGRQNDLIGDRTLLEIAIPGSHDAGMNNDDWGDCYPSGTAKRCNTITQRGNIKYQLEKGSRYFDIRPVLADDSDGTDNWRTGHTAKIWGGDLYGCKGQSKNSLVDDIHDFFNESGHSQEIVILKVSHCVMRKAGIAHNCTSDQLNSLAADLAGRFPDELFTHGTEKDVADKDGSKDSDTFKMTSLTVNEILNNGTKGKVILFISGENIDDSDDIDVHSDPPNGIFEYGKYSDCNVYIYDEYSDSNDFDTMRGDQFSKLLNSDNHINKSDNSAQIPFLLSWTLTLDFTDASQCTSENNYNGIRGLSHFAQWRLMGEIKHWVEHKDITKTLFPNILYVDDFLGVATRTAIYLNAQYDSLGDDDDDDDDDDMMTTITTTTITTTTITMTIMMTIMTIATINTITVSEPAGAITA